jgi:hypothetical protein
MVAIASRPSLISTIGKTDESKPPLLDLGQDTSSTDQTASHEPLSVMCPPPLMAYNYFYRSKRDTNFPHFPVPCLATHGRRRNVHGSAHLEKIHPFHSSTWKYFELSLHRFPP